MGVILQKTGNILTDQISFNVDFITDFAFLQSGHGQGMGNNRERKGVALYCIDSQADPVDCDAALVDQLSAQSCVALKPETPGIAFLPTFDNPCQPVNMPCHQVAAEAVGKPQSALQVDPGSLGKASMLPPSPLTI